MSPELDKEGYVFASLSESEYLSIPKEKYIASIREQEGITLILLQSTAKDLQIEHDKVFAKITMNVLSDLEALGFTAAFAKLLATGGITCNVIAGYYHDHVFVPWEKRFQAILLLEGNY